jgi:hypothetical protein
MSENVGSLWPTKVPSLSDTADIQEALRLYHYGANSGTGVGLYTLSNTDPANLVTTYGVATHLQYLKDRLDATDADLLLTLNQGDFTAKGQLLSASAASTLYVLDVGSNAEVLTVDLTTSSGLKWVSPEVTAISANTFTNKTISGTDNTFSNISLTSAVTGTLPYNNGGTGQSSYAKGDIVYASATNTLSKLAATTDGLILTLASGAPTWASAPVSLPTQTGNGGKLLTTDGSTASWTSTISAPTLTLATSSSTTDARISWDTTNKKLKIGDGTSSADFVSSTYDTLRNNNATLTTNNYTLVLTDKDKMVQLNNGTTAATVTIPLNSSVAFPVGSQINLFQTSTGQVTVTPPVITTSTFASGGAALATTFLISVANAAILIGQRVTGTGFTANTVVTGVSGTTITVSPAITSQVAGVVSFSIPVWGTPGLKLRSAYSSATLIKIVPDSRTSANYPNDTWILIGDIAL